MNKSAPLQKAREVIFQDAVQRDLTTARRASLLDLLWNERFLTREQLVARIEQRLGKNCFGKSAWEDTFYRDMRVVKQAFHAAGFHLAFRRTRQFGGYYLLGQPPLSPELDQILKSCVNEVDQRQIEFTAGFPRQIASARVAASVTQLAMLWLTAFARRIRGQAWQKPPG